MYKHEHWTSVSFPNFGPRILSLTVINSKEFRKNMFAIDFSKLSTIF